MGNRKILEMKLGKLNLPAMFVMQLVKELAHEVVSEYQKNQMRTRRQRKICCIDLYKRAVVIKRVRNYLKDLAYMSSEGV